MSALGPFRLEPQFMERVWGTRDLAPLYEHKPGPSGQPIGEVWLTGDACRVSTGASAGKTLAELAREFGRELVGDAASQPNRFPLLTKFLFPKDKLSVQVHPDDDYARRAGQPCGKTECWYVVAAKHGAQVALGLKPGVTREQLRGAIAQGGAEDLLNWLSIHPGEMIYVDAGTVHTIGSDCILLETQQNSDATYRLYDYGRARQLHLEQGLAAVHERTHAGIVTGHPELPDARQGENRNLVTSPYFSVDRFAISRGNLQIITRHMPPSSVQIVVALSGGGQVIAADHEPVDFKAGEAVVVPAAIGKFSIRASDDLQYLRMSLPQGKVAHPSTALHEDAATETRRR